MTANANARYETTMMIKIYDETKNLQCCKNSNSTHKNNGIIQKINTFNPPYLAKDEQFEVVAFLTGQLQMGHPY